MKKEWILNEDQLRRRKNSRLNTLKSCHGLQSQQNCHNNNNNNNLQQQFSPNFSTQQQNCHFGAKPSTTNVFLQESGILPLKSSKSAFLSATPTTRNIFANAATASYESRNNSPQSCNSSLLLDLADYGGFMTTNGVMRPRNGSADSSEFFGSRTSSHCSVELPTINSPLNGNTINTSKVFF